MSLKCLLGLHSWNGCKCSKCGKTKDGKHLWIDNKCSICDRKILFRDNRGTLIKSSDQAFASWQPYQFNNYTGSLIVKFANLNDAKNALSKLSFIHLASDKDELIASEVIEYGYYENYGKYDVVLWGPSFSIEMWEEAKDKLSNSGGNIFSSQEPKISKSISNENKADSKVEKVKFIKNEQMGDNKYKIYSAPSKQAAMDFLQNNPVTESFFYVIVETPEGNYARDIQGIYREDKP